MYIQTDKQHCSACPMPGIYDQHRTNYVKFCVLLFVCLFFLSHCSAWSFFTLLGFCLYTVVFRFMFLQVVCMCILFLYFIFVYLFAFYLPVYFLKGRESMWNQMSGQVQRMIWEMKKGKHDQNILYGGKIHGKKERKQKK